MGSGGQRFPPGLRADSVQSQRLWLLAACVLALSLAGLAPLATLVSGGSIAPMDLMSDSVEVTGSLWFIGGVADLNLLVWAAGAAAFFLGAMGLRRTDARLSRALAWLGALTVLLTLDDRFLLHEIVLPSLFGIPETITYALYAAVMALLLVRYRRVLLRQPEASTLLLALVALGVSVGLDVLGWDSTARRVAEETAKMLGAVAWLFFPAAIVVRHLNRQYAEGQRGL